MCVLHAEGINFEVDDFLKKSSLSPYKIWRKGEPTRISGRIYEDSGFSIDISEAEWNDFESQISDAENFIKENFIELDRLCKSSNVDDIRFDFPYYLRINETYFTQSEYLPPSFLKIIGKLNIGIEMSLYPPSEDDE